MTPISPVQTTTPKVIQPKISKLNLSALTQPVKKFFEPKENVRVRDVLREAGILTQKVVKAITPTEEDIVDKEDFEKRGIGITRFGEVAFKNPTTGKITYMDSLGAVGKLRNVAAESAETVGKELMRIIKSKRVGEKLIQEATEITPKITKGLNIDALIKPKTIEPLAQEARKYKSAEEFVKAQEKTERITIKGINASRDDIVSEINYLERKYNEKLANIDKLKSKLSEIKQIQKENKVFFEKELVENPIKAKTLYKSEINKGNRNIRDLEKSIRNAEEFTARAKVEWLESIRQSEKDLKLFKTKSQLTDIWNKANKVDDLATEAKKYKSADEFVKAQPKLYHGTEQTFDEFSLKTFGRATDSGDAGVGVYFTADKSYAKEFGSNIKEISVDLKNPYRYKTTPFFGGIGKEKFAKSIGLSENATAKEVTAKLVKDGYDGVIIDADFSSGLIKSYEVVVFDPKAIKTKSQLTDIYNQATKGVAKAEPAKFVMKDGILVKIKPLEEIFKLSQTVISSKTLLEAPQPIKNFPTVIQGKTFTLGTGQLTQPTIKEAKAGLKLEIKATKQEIKNAKIAKVKAEKLNIKQQKIRQEAIENINRQRGNTKRIIADLQKKRLSPEDIDNIVLEDGTKLVDTVKVKRNPDKSLAGVIRKSEIEDLAMSYTEKIPKQKWVQLNVVERTAQRGADVAKLYELPQVWFERKGLKRLFDPVIEAGRAAELQKNSFIKQFKDVGLWKKGGWFTADRFNLSAKEAEGVGKYFLSRQNKGYKVVLEDLSAKGQKFVKIFYNKGNRTSFLSNS